MSQISHNKAQLFLEGINSNSTKSAFDHLKDLVEILENKNDPDPAEVRLVSSIYEFIEKMSLLEHNMKTYASEGQKKTLGGKLSSLYEELSYSGSIYRD